MQAGGDRNTIFCKVLAFVIPVFVFSCIFNVPPFLEFKVEYIAEYLSEEQDNSTMRAVIIATDLFRDPNYSMYYKKWARLVVLGIIPFAMLVFFNITIYLKLHVRMSHLP